VEPVPLLRWYSERLRLPAVPPALLRCLRAAVPACSACFAPSRTHCGALGPGDGLRLPPLRVRCWKRQGLPRFLEDPYVHAPFLDPGGTVLPCLLWRAGVAFPKFDAVGSRDVQLSRLDSAACTFAVYASWDGSPRRCTQDSLPGGGQPSRTGLAPAGSHQEVSAVSYSLIAFPSSRLRLAQRSPCLNSDTR
jgi:hypothetical protein